MNDHQMTILHRILDEALAHSLLPWWEWDVKNNSVSFSPAKVVMLGYDPADFAGAGYQAFMALVHPEDAPRTMDAMRRVLTGSTSIYQTDYRIRKQDGQYTWYMDRGAVLQFDENGQPRVLRGLVIDLGPEINRMARDRSLMEMIQRALPPERERAGGHTTLCSGCKRLKIGKADWVPVTADFEAALTGVLSNALCDDCLKTLYPDVAASVISMLHAQDAT